MLQRLEITNYRSIAKADVPLRPFTVLVGANGSGKSNLLKLLHDLSVNVPVTKHLALQNVPTHIQIRTSTGGNFFRSDREYQKPTELESVRVFSIEPNPVGLGEGLAPAPEVRANGAGAVQVLDALKTGDREDLFDTIEARLREFVPEIEKLSFVPGGNTKRLQVRERGIPTPVPVSDLSEGTRLVLTILTIVHQERKPSIIGIEDIDRGLHPALFGKVVEVCRALTRGEGAPQIIATTHNPYFVDQFVDDEDSVLLVEKTNANTTFTPLSTRLAELGERTDSLGAVWYSGLVGATPKVELKHLPTIPERPAGE